MMQSCQDSLRMVKNPYKNHGENEYTWPQWPSNSSPLQEASKRGGAWVAERGEKVGLTTIETTWLIGAEKGGLEKQRSDWPRL